MKRLLLLAAISTVTSAYAVAEDHKFFIKDKVSTDVDAKESVVPQTPNNPVILYKFAIGIEAFPYLYKEPKFMKSKGVLYGFNFSYSHPLINDFILQPELRAAFGSTKYSSNRTGSMKNEPNTLFEARVLLKRGVNVSQSLDIFPFAGIGYRYKKDDTEGLVSTTNHNGYLRKSTYYYLPIGLNVEYKSEVFWGLSFLAEYDVFLKGFQKSGSVVGGRMVSINNKQKNGFGARIEALFNKDFENYRLSVGPFMNYWHIKRSKSAYFSCNSCGRKHMFFEPKNDTREFGIKLKFAF